MRAVVALTDTARAGTQRRLAAIARGLAKRGWEILFISLMQPGPVLEQLSRTEITTASLGLTNRTKAPASPLRFRRMVRAWAPQVVQTALWHANILARVALAGTGIPIISGYESTDDDKPRLRTLIDRWTRRLSVNYVAVSRSVAERAIERERLDRSRVTVIPFGLDAEAWAPRGRRIDFRDRHGIPADAPVAGWVGRMHPAKDLPTLIEAVGLLEGWWLVVAGDGEERPRVAEAVRRAGLEKRFVDVGETDDVPEVLESIDVFCLASRWEGMPLTLTEAMAAGKPIVATAVGGVPEMIREGREGLLVPPGDPRALAAAIMRALADPDMGARARDRAATHLSLEAMLDAYDSLWHRVVRG